jgi:hypothetical protein
LNGIYEGDVEESTVTLKRGDHLLISTEHITEAMATAAGRTELLVDCVGDSAEECDERICEAEGRSPKDDPTLMALRSM